MNVRGGTLDHQTTVRYSKNKCDYGLLSKCGVQHW